MHFQLISKSKWLKINESNHFLAKDQGGISTSGLMNFIDQGLLHLGLKDSAQPIPKCN